MTLLKSLVLRQMPSIGWVLFFAGVLGAWAALFAMQLRGAHGAYTDIYGSSFLAGLCAPSSRATPYGVMLLMWVLMSGAMMAPTFVPTLATYHDLTHTRAARGWGFGALIGGYMAVWLGFSILAAGAQYVLAHLDLLGARGASLSAGLNAGLLALAGAYQFSRLKNTCLSACRTPLSFFIGHWRPGTRGALHMGARLGVVCLGCCWALMLLGFVGGTMNLIWMGIATLIMVAEKLPDIGRAITAPLGVLLLSGAAYMALTAVLG